MMKKITYLLTAILTLNISACDNTPRELTELVPNKPYLFYSDSCPHCHEAQEFLNTCSIKVFAADVRFNAPKVCELLLLIGCTCIYILSDYILYVNIYYHKTYKK